MIDKGLTVAKFAVGAKGIAASDHRMVSVSVKIPGLIRPLEPMRWVVAPSVCWDSFGKEVDVPLRAWHAWLQSRAACSHEHSHEFRQQLLTDATSLFSCIMLANMWRLDSPYGRFTRGRTGCSRYAGSHWWNKACTNAASELKRAIGTSSEVDAKRHFRDITRIARRDSCASAVDAIEKAVVNSHELDQRTARQVKQFIRPKRSVSRLMKVGNVVVGENVSRKIWPEFFKAQSSLLGPLTPEQILARMGLSDQLEGAEPVTGDDAPSTDEAFVDDPFAAELANARVEYVEEEEDSASIEPLQHLTSTEDAGLDVSCHELAPDEKPDSSDTGSSEEQVTSNELDDEALHELRQRETLHAEAASRNVRNQGGPHTFNMFELAEAMAAANVQAGTSPLDPIPVAALVCHTEAMRACILSLTNAAYSWQCLPWLWRNVPISPIPKPGKCLASFDGHRPIYLLSGVFKFLDKMLFSRINSLVRKASDPWQAGGSRGADVATWTLDAVLRSRLKQKEGKTWIGFLDAESAYCRPPKECILEGLVYAEIDDGDWLCIRSILHALRGCVKLNGEIIGEWDIESGAPQGGSLSTPLFQSILPELEQQLRAAGCGIWVGPPDEKKCLCPALATSTIWHYLRLAPKCCARLYVSRLSGPGRSESAGTSDLISPLSCYGAQDDVPIVTSRPPSSLAVQFCRVYGSTNTSG